MIADYCSVQIATCIMGNTSHMAEWVVVYNFP
jgi:hypothetical protein